MLINDSNTSTRHFYLLILKLKFFPTMKPFNAAMGPWQQSALGGARAQRRPSSQTLPSLPCAGHWQSSRAFRLLHSALMPWASQLAFSPQTSPAHGLSVHLGYGSPSGGH